MRKENAAVAVQIKIIGYVLVASGLALVAYVAERGFANPPWRFEVGMSCLSVGVLTLIVGALISHVDVLLKVYAMGYRHGRHDATTSLLEQGLWLSASAERKAREGLESEEEW